ncbi:hypothetical protein FRB99_006842 [Tulasnella sp. 403]|nr:hypothetical protein FRB99_006842 [Tulasnella sp. 403]
MDDLPVISGRKRLLSENDDNVLTPKKSRAAQLPITPNSSRTTRTTRLPSQLQALLSAYITLEDALIPALASGGVAAPTPDKDDPQRMNIMNVLNHTNVPGVSLDNLKRLVYLLEWDAEKGVSSTKAQLSFVEPDDPLGVPSTPRKPSKQWTRGGNGIVVSATTQLNRTTGRRSAVYGIGIQIQTEETPKGKGRAGMHTVTRWLEDGETRKQMVEDKIYQWVEVHRKAARDSARVQRSRASSPTPVQIPSVPAADLPPLATPASSAPPASASPVKRLFQTPVKTPTRKSTIPFPTPEPTPMSAGSDVFDSVPSTPVKTNTPVTTSSTARRDALRERIRQRSLQNGGTPTRNRVSITVGTNSDGSAKTKVVGHEEMRRRCVLGRLEWVAECVASLFSNQTTGAGALSTPRRRIMRMDEVVRVVVKSAKSPLSDAFLTSRVIDRDTWLEMPAAIAPVPSPVKVPVTPSTPRKTRFNPPTSPSPSSRIVPTSPGRRFVGSPGSGLTKEEIEEELLNRKPGEGGSPKKVRAPVVGVNGQEVMTLREVRERIRKELEST